MHPEQTDFCRSILSKYQQHRVGSYVLDVGSRDINGNNTVLFEGGFRYVGVDVSPGPNVDVVCKAHEMSAVFPEQLFDVVISTEMLEHDPFWFMSLRTMLQVLRRGGLLLITCATTGRPEHGTRRTATVDDNPAVDLLGNDYYRNLTEDDLREALPAHAFIEFGFDFNDSTHDIYFWGIKK